MVEITRDELLDLLYGTLEERKAGGIERLDKVADAILARLGDGWLPISGAPKTGELVDLWVGGYRVADARYSAARDCWLTPHDTIVIGVPTHFMFPLSPPKESA